MAREHGVEGIRERLHSAVAARQDLRATGSARRQLERNRREIVRLQQQLSHALVALNRPATVEHAA